MKPRNSSTQSHLWSNWKLVGSQIPKEIRSDLDHINREISFSRPASEDAIQGVSVAEWVEQMDQTSEPAQTWHSKRQTENSHNGGL